jgi:hypothetical protein
LRYAYTLPQKRFRADVYLPDERAKVGANRVVRSYPTIDHIIAVAFFNDFGYRFHHQRLFVFSASVACVMFRMCW